MAEKYGEIPPRFTKQWWDYVWYYYKWHIIITVIAVIVAAVTMVQCATRTKYDMNVIYAGHKSYSEEEINRLQELVSEYITDIDENGEKNVMFLPLMFSDNPGSEEYDYAIQMKLDMTFTEDYTYIYLMDKAQTELYLQREHVSDTFTPVDTFADITETEIMCAIDGRGYAVSLSDSAVLKNNNIYCEDLYLLVVQNNKPDEKSVQSYEDALNTAKELIKQ